MSSGFFAAFGISCHPRPFQASRAQPNTGIALFWAAQFSFNGRSATISEPPIIVHRKFVLLVVHKALIFSAIRI